MIRDDRWGFLNEIFIMKNNSQELYNQYREITQKAADFNHAAAVLAWDQEVFMPPKGFFFRGRQLASLTAQAHELLTSDGYGAILKKLSEKNDLADEAAQNLRLSLEDFEKNKKLPAPFIEKLT